jgi:hypothetical protein
MAPPRRFRENETDQLPPELRDMDRLIAASDGVDKADLRIAWNRVTESFHRRRRILSLVQEALAQLRLDVKYMIFDLETTRRERDQLQEQLEEEDRGF